MDTAVFYLEWLALDKDGDGKIDIVENIGDKVGDIGEKLGGIFKK